MRIHRGALFLISAQVETVCLYLGKSTIRYILPFSLWGQGWQNRNLPMPNGRPPHLEPTGKTLRGVVLVYFRHVLCFGDGTNSGYFLKLRLWSTSFPDPLSYLFSFHRLSQVVLSFLVRKECFWVTSPCIQIPPHISPHTLPKPPLFSTFLLSSVNLPHMTYFLQATSLPRKHPQD